MTLLASRRTLQLPELVRDIIKHLDNPRCGKSLLAAARVNHLWANIATEVLWRRPPYKALRAFGHNHARLAQYYAPKVRTLELGDRYCSALDPAMSPLARVRLPRLRELTLNADAVLHDDAYVATLRSMLLGPPTFDRGRGDGGTRGSGSGSSGNTATELARFRFCGSARRLMGVLDVLRDARAPLRELALVCHSPAPDPVLFLGFLEACSPPLQSPWSSLSSTALSPTKSPLAKVEFLGCLALTVTVPVLVNLAGRPGLESININHCLTGAELEEVLQAFTAARQATQAAAGTSGSISPDNESSATQPFAPLKRLTIRVMSAAVPLLLD